MIEIEKVRTEFEADTDTEGNPVRVGFYKIQRSSPRIYWGHDWSNSGFSKEEKIPADMSKPLEVVVEPIK